MSNLSKRKMWGIRAGKGGNAHQLFVKESVIALADSGLGDLSKLEGTRDCFYKTYRKLHPDETRTGSAGVAGKFYRFANEVEMGDLILYPSLEVGRPVYIGEVQGAYVCDATDAEFPHRRTVKWKYIVAKEELSQAAQYELGAARTFFKFQRNTQEVSSKISARSAKRYRPVAKVK